MEDVFTTLSFYRVVATTKIHDNMLNYVGLKKINSPLNNHLFNYFIKLNVKPVILNDCNVSELLILMML